MRKIAIFGNAGAGKSWLGRRLAEITGLPLYVFDKLEYPDGRYRPGEPNGGRLPPESVARLHAEILKRDNWIIDGYGGPTLDAASFAAADTLVHVDPPLWRLYWGVTKRWLQGLAAPPPGWPANTPLWASTLQSYRTIPLCHARLTPRYRQRIALAHGQRAFALRTEAEIARFLDEIARETR